MSFFSGLFRTTYPINLTGFTDWHCHILPGVDDGVQNMTDSVAILKAYEDAGIAEVWLTPHIMEDIPNTPESLMKRFKELQECYRGSVKLNLAAENMIDSLFLERLEKNDLLPIGNDGKTLLVETSYFNAPMKFSETIEAIKSKGYFPLLAHPERYNYLDSLEDYRRLKAQGVLFQMNLMSLTGHYGPVVKKKAEELLSEGMYDRAGSDLHRKEHLDIIRRMKISSSQKNVFNRTFSITTE
ncbi:MAG: capsular biosynthesis protein [Muribaculaceae bacterium]|nr:capsular biosynthesis protein [Muribaculaceae bacterium]